MQARNSQRCWALVPLKGTALGKSRLAPALGAAERIRLMDDMYARVLEVLRNSPVVEKIAVVTSETAAVPAGALALPDAGVGANAAIERGAQDLFRQGAPCLLVLSADLPLLESADVQALVEASQAGGCSIAPDHHGRGTNAICFAKPVSFHFQFGEGSFAKHLAEAARLGLTPTVVQRAGLAFDVDEPADLARLRGETDG